MRKIKYVLISLLIITTVFSCKNKENTKTVVVESKKIDNFSDIYYKDSPDRLYFYEIERLPHGFSLGDFQDYNSILYLTESANIVPFDDENLKYFLTAEEMKTAFDTIIDSTYTEPVIRNIEYYPYERLVTDKYVILIINSRGNCTGRGYTFSLRTFDFEGELISKIDLAKWHDCENIYHSGFIMPDFSVKIKFDNDSIVKYKIQDNGEIIKTI